MFQWKNQIVLFIQNVEIVAKRAKVSIVLLLMFWRTQFFANSETLHKIVLRELSVLGDDVSKLSSVVTDEASVKAGKLSVHDSDMNFSHSFLFTEFDIDWHQHVLSLVIKQHISWRYLNTWGNYGSFLRTLLRELQF